MSVREDERQKNCSSRGLGVTAAAIGVGVGVGAALYYFFNKRAENPVGTGSTSEWESEHALSEQQKRTRARDKAFRQRTWTQEECSVCFETMQSSQELMSLPCTHRFHQSCILPWLQEQNTCPNCRKTTE